MNHTEHSIVQIVGSAIGTPTPHDGRYVVAWNPHTAAGVLEVISTDNVKEARRFQHKEIMEEWKTISNVEPVRPWDGKANRPLCALTLHIITYTDGPL